MCRDLAPRLARAPQVAALVLTLLAITSLAAIASSSPIDDKYAALGGGSGFLGAPAGPELPTPDNSGRYRHYSGGSIYWSPQSGAHEVHGLIRDKWAQLGWERSSLGYPTSDEEPLGGSSGRVSRFQRGRIEWTPQGGAVVRPLLVAGVIVPNNVLAHPVPVHVASPPATPVHVATPPATPGHLASPLYMQKLTQAMSPDAHLTLIDRQQQVTPVTRAALSQLNLRPGDILVGDVKARVERTAGKAPRYLLPVSAIVRSESGEDLYLQPFLEPTTEGMTPSATANEFTEDIYVGLVDLEHPEMARATPDVPAALRSLSSNVKVTPLQTTLVNTGLPYRTVAVVGYPEGEFAVIEVTAFGRTSTTNLPVLRPKIRIVGPARAQALGVDNVALTVSIGAAAGPISRHVTLSAEHGQVEPADVTVSPEHPGTAHYRGWRMGTDHIVASADGLGQASLPIRLDLPLQFVFLALLGGGFGSVILRLLRPFRLVTILTRYFVGGVLMGLLVALLFVLGVNVTAIAIPGQSNPLAIFVISALGAIAAIPLVSKWSEGFRGFLDDPSPAKPSATPPPEAGT